MSYVEIHGTGVVRDYKYFSRVFLFIKIIISAFFIYGHFRKLKLYKMAKIKNATN